MDSINVISLSVSFDMVCDLQLVQSIKAVIGIRRIDFISYIENGASKCGYSQRKSIGDVAGIHGCVCPLPMPDKDIILQIKVYC